ncbi:MAG TPA: Eco57I restriction-modification methylase domain-containing protein, partial [Phycisphaerae bacterium]|nr:Eco57I restriction-modification methylase domain-containing protein [Phycisphaerae bacterium]
EAVEITQLALWIRTAQRGKTLADLTRNIKCGNSVVDDREVTAEAFDWHGEFARVFDAGGFDCVVSNPPYVKLQNFRRREPEIAGYLPKRYRSAQTGNFDMYLPFIERGVELLRGDGRMGFIAPSLWLFNEYGRGLRGLIAERRALERFVDFKSFQVFRDATTYTALQFFAGSPRDKIQVADAGDGNVEKLGFHDVSYRGRGEQAWALLCERDQDILDRMRANSVTLADASAAIIVGIQTSADAVYHLIKLGPGRYFSKALKGEVEIDDDIMKPLVSGEDAVPFATPPTDKYLLFPYHVTDDECRLFTENEISKRFKYAWAYLRENEETLRARESRKFDDDEWYRFGRHQNIDKQYLPKIGIPETVSHLSGFIDPRGERCFNNVRVNGILELEDRAYSLWFVLALVNSHALDFCFRRTAKPKDREYFEANKQFIAPLPIPKTKDQKPLAGIARKLADLHRRRLDAHARVHRRFVTDLWPAELLSTSPLPPPLPLRIRDFDKQARGKVLDELQKFAKRRFKRGERDDWEDYLTKQTDGLAKINNGIRDLVGELNDRVYRLFGLPKDAIKTIEAESAPHTPR